MRRIRNFAGDNQLYIDPGSEDLADRLLWVDSSLFTADTRLFPTRLHTDPYSVARKHWLLIGEVCANAQSILRMRNCNVAVVKCVARSSLTLVAFFLVGLGNGVEHGAVCDFRHEQYGADADCSSAVNQQRMPPTLRTVESMRDKLFAGMP